MFIKAIKLGSLNSEAEHYITGPYVQKPLKTMKVQLTKQ